jgi:hypothetical protein
MPLVEAGRFPTLDHSYPRLVQGVPAFGQRGPQRADPQRQGRCPARAAEVAVREVPLLLDDGLRGDRGALRAGEASCRVTRSVFPARVRVTLALRDGKDAP